MFFVVFFQLDHHYLYNLNGEKKIGFKTVVTYSSVFSTIEEAEEDSAKISAASSAAAKADDTASPAIEQTTSSPSDALPHKVAAKPSARWTTALQKVNRYTSTGRLARGPFGHNELTNIGDSLASATSCSERPEDLFEVRARALRSPTLSTYTDLKRKLANSSKEWILQFLEINGLGILLETLGRLSEKKSPCFVDTFLQLECVACVKAVMNSQSGLDYIIENPDFTRKFASGESSIKSGKKTNK